LLEAETFFRALARTLETDKDPVFAGVMVQQLNLILLTATEVLELRLVLKECRTNPRGQELFKALYHSWCRDPVATFALCLLAQHYRLASHLVDKFAQLEISVNLLLQLDRLVQLIESPIFSSLRMQLLEPARFPYLIKSLYGILMLLPQSSAFHTLRQRLSSVPTLALLHLDAHLSDKKPGDASQDSGVLDDDELLAHFDSMLLRARQMEREKLLNSLVHDSSPPPVPTAPTM